MARQLLSHRSLYANEDHAHVQFACCEDRSFHFGARSVISPHCIKGDGDHFCTDSSGGEKLGRSGLCVNNFASLVIAAMRTSIVWEFPLVAIWAFAQGWRR